MIYDQAVPTGGYEEMLKKHESAGYQRKVRHDFKLLQKRVGHASPPLLVNHPSSVSCLLRDAVIIATSITITITMH